ncbi:MAG: hypothetical protein DMG73_14860 [Acidobacteria bacterium]|nr:MAG: hypothetical protein DMG73_14860 [Acidobacteriota bacterium]
MIEQQAGRLSRIVEEMFALTRVDMNQLPLEIGELYLDEVIADTTRAACVLAERKGVHLKSQNIQEAPYHGDQRLLRQMISNLLDNAIKFTPQGGTVEVGLHQVNSSYQITVADTGCGISAELQPRIFERFFRADKARLGTGGLGGAGLGLAIARSIAELHHGRLSLQHCGAEGSIFCISLPFRARVTRAERNSFEGIFCSISLSSPDVSLRMLALVCRAWGLKSMPSVPIKFPVASWSGAVTSKPSGSCSTNGFRVFSAAASSSSHFSPRSFACVAAMVTQPS